MFGAIGIWFVALDQTVFGDRDVKQRKEQVHPQHVAMNAMVKPGGDFFVEAALDKAVPSHRWRI